MATLSNSTAKRAFARFCVSSIYNIHVIYLLFFAASVTLGGSCCKKDKNNGPAVIQGTVFESGSNKPIVGATVFLGSKENGTWGNYGYKTETSTTTDANGKYSFSFTFDGNKNYAVAARKNPPYPTDSEYEVVPDEKSSLINLHLTASATGKIHIKNVNPFDSQDRLYINIGTGAPNPDIYGKNIDSLIYIPLIGNTNNKLIYLIYKNQIETRKDTSVYIAAFDTVFFNINY